MTLIEFGAFPSLVGVLIHFGLFLLLTVTAVQAGDGLSWLNPELREREERRGDLLAEMEALPSWPLPQAHERAGFHSGFAGKAESLRWVQVDLGAEMDLESVIVVPAVLGGAEAYGFPKRFRVDASNDALFAESVTLLDHSHEDAPSVLAPWHMQVRGVKARFVRFTATKLAPQPGLGSRSMFALGELLVFSAGRNAALGCVVEAGNAVETLPTWSPRHLVDGTHALGLPVTAGSARTNGWHSAISSTAGAVKWVEVHLAEKQAVDEIRLIPAHPSDYPDRFGFGFPRRFKVEADETVLFDGMSADFTNPGDTPVVFPTPGLQAKTIRVTATSLWERSADFVFALAELQAVHRGQNIALGAQVTSSDDTLTASWQREHLVDGLTSAGTLVSELQWLAALSSRRVLAKEAENLHAAVVLEEAIAQSRAWWLAGGLVTAGILLSVVFMMRLRRVRHEEMESLRQRISRDLHDEIGSHLGSIRLMSELAIRDGGGDESLQEIHRLAGEAAESMRGIIWLVREGDAPKFTHLVEAMRQSAAALLKGCEWTLDAPTEATNSPTASLEFHRQVFLFFREAAHNITRHAGATAVKIEIRWKAKRFHLHIEDNGCGFDADAVTAGNGLANLRHRAGVLGGTLQIDSEPAKGTRITLEAPFP
jgi:signal transduction histidine kinase